ncbi:MAG: HlyD family type I secretion periplasmic adaptor subunit, partial [Burkholderiales bacterium]
EAGQGAADALALQRRLFETRRTALRSELAVIEESIAGLEAQIRGTEAARATRHAQIEILKQELEGQRKLAEDGFLPRNRVLEQERQLAQLQGGIAQDEAGILRGQRGVGELRLRQVALQQSFRQQVETELTEVQKEVGALTSRMEALRFELGNTELRSPVDGIVVGLSVHTNGGVIQAGAPLLQIVPEGEPLRVEAQLSTEMIDSVQQGLQVDIMFPAFNASVTPNVPGIVQGISADVLVDERSGRPYYRLDVDVTGEGMDKLAEHEIKPGMPAMVFVRTGERTAFNYLIKPLRDRLRTALTEE